MPEYVLRSNRERSQDSCRKWEMTLLGYTEEEAKSTARRFLKVNPTLNVTLKEEPSGRLVSLEPKKVSSLLERRAS